MKSILIITELFEIGGLETHLRGEITWLSRNGYAVHLATGPRFDNALLPPEVSSVTSDLALGPEATWAQALETIESLRELIRTYSIDYVHAHPFTSLVPGMLVAELENLPFVMTLHGPASLAPCYGPIYDFLLTSVILPNASVITCVSEETAAIASPYLSNNNLIVISNGVDTSAFGNKGALSDTGAHWLVISRLDHAKVPGIVDFILKAFDAALPGVLVVGDGPARSLLEDCLSEKGLTNFARLIGAHTNIDELMAAAGGVAGMGRVVLEGLASRKPVFLVGYDGVKGLMDGDLVAVAARANFSGRNLSTMSAEAFLEQASRVSAVDLEALHALVGNRFSEQKLWLQFSTAIESNAASTSTVLGDLYRMLEIEALTDTGPYLASVELVERLSKLIYAAGRFQAQLAGSYENFRRMKMENDSSLRHLLSDREARVDELTKLLVSRDAHADALSRDLVARQVEISKLRSSNNEYASRVESMNEAAAAREAELSEKLSIALDRYVLEVGTLESAKAEYEAALMKRESDVVELNLLLKARDNHIFSSDALINRILQSHSWRITRPLRFARRLISRQQVSAGERAKLRSYGESVYRYLPLPSKPKSALRRVLARTIRGSYVGSERPVVDRPELSELDKHSQNVAISAELNQLDSSNGPRDRALAPMKEAADDAFETLAADINGAQKHDSRVVPYFGVRQPHGKRRAAILTNQLLDWHDGRPRFGGGERYALELARLLRDLSIEVTFFQPTIRAAQSGEYYSFEVNFLGLNEAVGEFSHGICTNFTELTADYDHVYYHLPEYASGLVREDAIMTCHGIWFDHDNYPGALFRTAPWFEHLYHAFASPSAVVSVDTNSIGVIRSFWPKLSENMRFIPNFFDKKGYFPDSTKRNKERLTVLFPRRSQINRGSRIFGDVLKMIPHDVDIVWLGEGDPVDTEIVKAVCRADNRASFHVADFDEMAAWYQKADIAVIPTIACEGTSLSCIEALACGCAVVSTNVGGLPDVIFDEFNGLLVDPNAGAIAHAINRFIEDDSLRERLQRSASETASNFELNAWRRRWVELLHSHGWINDDIVRQWRSDASSERVIAEKKRSQNWIILTRNAIHGGVESLIREEARILNAPVIVCGGHDKFDTCPFTYTRADDRETLSRALNGFDVVLYHWIPEWAVEVVKESNCTSIEFIHRIDTSECDKTVPTSLVTHSAFLARYIYENFGRFCRVIDHPIAIERFTPEKDAGGCVGAITSYYETKGIDIFLRAWAMLQSEFPDTPVKFYGDGYDLPKLEQLAAELGVNATFLPATREPWEAMKDFRCFVVPSRVEGLPVAVLEALAANIPVVASGLPGMVEFNNLSMRRGYESYLDLAKPEDPADFARVLREVLMRNRRQESHLYISEYYQARKHCSDLIDLVSEIHA
ncbi:glycosyltransferase [Caballeronia sp. LZ043]|uniref:glycosyltransferase n=1 Tax=Caballeronia sp. LZ043 TaxID=3038569 RepID=UPI002859D84D|nr:glycosyltransferase [Caballeronia sp. LZ043]MDR5826165.1 glycosyltransferase [Caballeronia sp. LZ043]